MPDLNENEKSAGQAPAAEESSGSWKGEMEKTYYYDDAHGYEEFDPENGPESEEE